MTTNKCFVCRNRATHEVGSDIKLDVCYKHYLMIQGAQEIHKKRGAALKFSYLIDLFKVTSFWSWFTSLMVFAYITIGAVTEIVKGINNHHVASSFTFVAFSALIFIGRVANAHATNSKSTLYADMYGATVLTILTLLKIYYG